MTAVGSTGSPERARRVDPGASEGLHWWREVLLAAVGEGRTVAACSHGDVIPEIVAAAVRRGAELVGPSTPKKGARYECDVADGRIVRLVAVAAPDRVR